MPLPACLPGEDSRSECPKGPGLVGKTRLQAGWGSTASRKGSQFPLCTMPADRSAHQAQLGAGPAVGWAVFGTEAGLSSSFAQIRPDEGGCGQGHCSSTTGMPPISVCVRACCGGFGCWNLRSLQEEPANPLLDCP